MACCSSGIESWSGSGVAWERARQGRGCALVVEGPAGIGKTALLAAGRDAAEGEGFRVLRARGAELEREFAFGVVRQLVRTGRGGGVGAGAGRAAKGAARSSSPAAGLPWPGLRSGTAGAVAPDPSFAVLHGLYWLCANLAADAPPGAVGR